MESRNKSYTSNDREKWNHFKITQTIPEQNTKKERNSGTTNKQPYWALHTYCRKC